jgi:hypothetical protein
MDHDYKTLVSATELRPVVVSPHKSPQLNETICGCRCGCGCGCAGHGNDDDSERVSDTETAINSNNSDDDERFPSDRRTRDRCRDSRVACQPVQPVLSPQSLSHQRIVWLMGRTEGARHGESPIDWDQTSARLTLDESQEDLSGSLDNEPCSIEARSNQVSDNGSIQRMSPGPEIGSWLVPERMWVQEVQLVYYFNVRPLRLSAEYQHARGRAVEHLLVRDEVCFADVED